MRDEVADPVPLVVTAHMVPGARVQHYEPLMLDGILAWAVVHEATQGRGLAAAAEPYRIDLPLSCLWRSPEGLPLWAASSLTTVGPSAQDVIIQTKRPQSGRWTKTKSGRLLLTPTAGRWRARQIPRPATVCDAWRGWCEGDPYEVRRLLAMVTHLGKRKAAGLGVVQRWKVEEASAFDLVMGGRLTRPVPAAAADAVLPQRPEEATTMVAWTPPHWLTMTWAEGWREGVAA